MREDTQIPFRISGDLLCCTMAISHCCCSVVRAALACCALLQSAPLASCAAVQNPCGNKLWPITLPAVFMKLALQCTCCQHKPPKPTLSKAYYCAFPRPAQDSNKPQKFLKPHLLLAVCCSIHSSKTCCSPKPLWQQAVPHCSTSSVHEACTGGHTRGMQPGHRAVRNWAF